jgi:DNA invertase Pin-like site-specific DNA recombinase
MAHGRPDQVGHRPGGERGVGFRSLTENVDTTTPAGTLIFHLFGALAEFERNLTRERTRAGLLAAKARGKVGGRKRVMTDRDVAVAKTLLREGSLTVEEVAEQAGVSMATLYRYLPGGRAGVLVE